MSEINEAYVMLFDRNVKCLLFFQQCIMYLLVPEQLSGMKHLPTWMHRKHRPWWCRYVISLTSLQRLAEKLL